MNKTILVKTSLIISIIGIFLIILFANNLEPEVSKISSITVKDLDNYIKIQGQIEDFKEILLNNSEYLELFKVKDDSGSIEVVFRKRISLQTSQEIEIVGKISEYQGSLQIEASKIKVFS